MDSATFYSIFTSPNFMHSVQFMDFQAILEIGIQSHQFFGSKKFMTMNKYSMIKPELQAEDQEITKFASLFDSLKARYEELNPLFSEISLTHFLRFLPDLEAVIDKLQLPSEIRGMIRIPSIQELIEKYGNLITEFKSSVEKRGIGDKLKLKVSINICGGLLKKKNQDRKDYETDEYLNSKIRRFQLRQRAWSAWEQMGITMATGITMYKFLNEIKEKVSNDIVSAMQLSMKGFYQASNERMRQIDALIYLRELCAQKIDFNKFFDRPPTPPQPARPSPPPIFIIPENMISPLLASFEGNMNYEEYIKKCGEEAVKKKIEEEAKTLKRKSTREESGPVLKAVKQEVIEPWEEEFAHGKEN